MEMTLTKGRDGWSAKTEIALGIEKPADIGGKKLPLFLSITTSKSSRGGIDSSANVHARYEGGTVWDIFGDFRADLFRDRTVRCTEKTVREMHEHAMKQASALIERAKAFYADKGISAAA